MALLASPAWAAGLTHLGLPAALAAVGATGDARQESDALVRQARAAMSANRLDEAEQLVAKAEKLGYKYDPVSAKIDDTPAKVRKDLDMARSRGGNPARPVGGPKLPALLPNKSEDPRAARVEPDVRRPGPSAGPAANNSPFTLRPSDMPQDNDTYPAPQKPSSPSNYESAFGATELNPNNLPPDRNALPPASPAARPGAGPRDEGYSAAPARPGTQRLPSSENMSTTRLPKVDDAVRPAGGPAGRNNNDRFPVAQGNYDSRRNNTPVRPVQGESAVVPPNNNGLKAEKAYQEGLDLLGNGEREGALAKFSEAWKFQDQLDAATRQDLKDKLSLLRAAPASSPAAQNQPEPIDAEQHLRYQKFLGELAAEKQAAQKLANESPKQALASLNGLRQRIADADLDPQGRRILLGNMDRSIKELQTYIDRNRSDIELKERNNEVRAERARDQQMTIETQNKIAQLVEKFNRLMDEERFAEAEVIAKQVRELAPESSIAENLGWKSHFAKSHFNAVKTQKDKEANFVTVLGNVDDSSNPFDDNRPFQFGSEKEWKSLTHSRRQWERENGRKLNPAEQEIEKSLGKQVEVNFKNQPLSEVIDVLSKMSGINIVLDPRGLHAEAVTSDTPVTFDLHKPIMLKSALDLILGQLELSYVIQSEVLLITSKDMRDSHTYTRVYYVADLVTPIPNFTPNYNIGLPGAIRESFNTLGAYGGLRGGFSGGNVPLTLTQNDANGQPQQPGTAMGQMNALAQMAGAAPQMQNGSPIPLPNPGTRSPVGVGSHGPGGLGGGVIADFDTLIDLITSTISPDTWTDNGGQGSISGFPTNLSLVVSQTQDIHADIADLLQQLRRLQDLQVTIEVRFITLNDNFFERVGVDFDFQIDDNTGLTQNSVLPDDNGRSIAFGLAPNGQPTQDFDMRFSQDTFASAVPQFGGFDVTSAANFGFAILSDIEVFFLLQALQGDQRTNVLQAPKVTLFNGQQAFVTDSVQRPFVTQIIPVVGDFAAAQQPVVTVLNEGTSLSVQAVVSSDRRFVRLTLVPMFTKIGDVQTFTFTGRTTSNTGTTVQDPTDPTKTVTNGGQSTTEGTTVQLPSLSVTTVATTVSVPDGGTVLLGGIKRLQEGRNERGIPLLSKIPYISRLFKNVGIGRTTQSLMMMVTPRIIIQEEEEDKLGLGMEPG